jgi:hypothetical protein
MRETVYFLVVEEDLSELLPRDAATVVRVQLATEALLPS